MRSAWIVAAVLALAGGCGDASEVDRRLTAPAFRGVAEVDAVEQLVDPATGATLSLGGARLVVPPGALAEPAVLRLIHTTNPALEMPSDDGALGGHVPLFDAGFAIASDRRVHAAAAVP